MRLTSALGACLVAVLGLDCGRGTAEVARAAREEGRLGVATLTSAESPGSASPATSVLLAEPLAPASRHVALEGAACVRELIARRIPHEAAGPKRGVETPIRLLGPLSGVTFRTLLPDRERARSSYELFDCRLLLALDDFAKVLVTQGINEVMHFSAYRPPPAGWPEGQLGVRHDGGLAIDVGYFRRADGTGLNVERDFAARRAERPCTPGPPPRDATMESLALRAVVCAALQAKIFHLILTPDYDWTHRNHFHLEVTPGAQTFVAR